ncbi:glycosyltransferase [uncultured Fusobacterium sp.]|uniref:glycosyltransferase n=1 Tax=uncultured Fusobacterium sp. TaxID=159267 RepID=UPI0025D83DF5|nr:glycosyltransferase [uncultured Fusobacterium sp.]
MKKKILFYTSGVGLGGVEKVVLEVLKEVDKSKFDIKLALQYENENLFENEIPKEVKYKYMLPQKIIDKSLYYKERKKNIFYKMLYSFMLSYEKYTIKKNYLEFSKDREIVIDFKSGDFLKLINLENRVDKKRICWLHGEITKLNKYEKRKRFLRENLNKCDKVVCICEDMKNGVIKEIPELKEKLEVIYNPFDIEKIKIKSSDYSEIKDNEKNLLEDNYIIMVSRLDNVQKDFDTIIKAFKIVKQKRKDIKLYLLGEGPDREKIENMIKNENLQEYIKLLGVKRNPYPWIKGSKLLVHSSRYEGFGLVLVEALILGKVVISSNCKVGPREILDNGKYGSLVEVGDCNSMAQEILELLQENSIKREKYLSNIDESIERFDKKNIIKQIERVLEGI